MSRLQGKFKNALTIGSLEPHKLEAQRKEFGVTDAVVELEGITVEMAVKLGEKGVKTLDDVADNHERRVARNCRKRRTDGGQGQRDYHGRARPLVCRGYSLPQS